MLKMVGYERQKTKAQLLLEQSSSFATSTPGTTKTSTPETIAPGTGFGPLKAVALPFQVAEYGLKRIQAAPALKGKTGEERRQIIEKEPGISELIPSGLRQIPGYKAVAKAGGELLKARPEESPVVPTLAKLLSFGAVDLEHPVQSIGKISEVAVYSTILDPAVRTSIVKDIKAIRTGFVDDLLKKGYTREEALAFSKEGGFFGRFNPKVKALEQRFDDLARAKANAPTAQAARRYEKAQQAIVKRIREEQQAGFAKIPGVGGKEPQLQIPGVGETGKERGFITSAKEALGVAPEVKAGVAGAYEPITNRATFARAQQFVNTDETAALLRLSEGKSAMGKLGADYTATAEALAFKYQKAGRWNEAASVINDAAETLTSAGQTIQAAAMLGKLTPEGAMALAARRIQAGAKLTGKATPERVAQAKAVTKSVVEKLRIANKEIAEQVVKETEQLSLFPKIAKSVRKFPAEESLSAEQRLANRIQAFQRTKEPDPITDMINTLYKVAKEVLPKKAKVVPKNQIELIGQAIKDKATYGEVWTKAQELVKAKYADNPNALELLDDYFHTVLGQPFAKKQLETAVRQGIKAEEINLGQIVRQHYSVAEEARGSLTQKLIDQAGVSTDDAAKLASQIEIKFNQLAKAKKESILNAIFKERSQIQKTLDERIVELSNLGALDEAKYYPLVAQKLGIPMLSPQLAEQIAAQARKIQAVPANLPYQKFLEIQELAGMIERNVPKTVEQKASNWLFELWTLPKTTAASFDLSAAMRQGIFPAASFPKQWGEAFKAQFQAVGSEAGYAKLMNEIMLHPRFKMAMEAKVSFADVAGKLSMREDRFISTWAEKIPLLGKGVRASNRAYTGFLNKLRMDMFGRMADDAERLGIKIDQKWLHDTGRFINDATGRGDWKAFRGTANKILQGLMFSPRLMYSRLNLLASPVTYLRAAPQVRAQLWKSLFAFAGSGTAVITLMDLIHGVDVGKDPRSADFGKIKIGNTRFDIWGGFQQYLRIAAQVASGKYISTTTGKVITLGEGYKPLTRKDILLRGLESKEAPFAALLSTILTGKDFEGNKLNVPKEVGKRFIPMALNDLWEVYQNDPELLPAGFLGLFGVGVQSYPMTDAIEKMKEINVSANPAAEFDKLAKENPKLAEQVKQAKIQESFTEFDWSLTYMGVENGDRAQFLVERFNRLSKEEATSLYDDLRKKRLISDRVADQIKFLMANPDYEIPQK